MIGHHKHRVELRIYGTGPGAHVDPRNEPSRINKMKGKSVESLNWFQGFLT
jgi:hypothetical protein